MNLIVPKSIALAERSRRARIGDVAPPQSLADEIAAPIPEGLPLALFWKIHVIPVGIRSESKGGMKLTEKLRQDMLWAHGLGKIVGMGPLAFKSAAYEGASPDDLPKVGDLILFNPRGPARIERNGLTIFLMNDDAIQARVNPEHAEGYAFLEGVQL